MSIDFPKEFIETQPDLAIFQSNLQSAYIGKKLYCNSKI